MRARPSNSARRTTLAAKFVHRVLLLGGHKMPPNTGGCQRCYVHYYGYRDLWTCEIMCKCNGVLARSARVLRCVSVSGRLDRRTARRSVRAVRWTAVMATAMPVNFARPPLSTIPLRELRARLLYDWSCATTREFTSSVSSSLHLQDTDCKTSTGGSGWPLQRRAVAHLHENQC